MAHTLLSAQTASYLSNAQKDEIIWAICRFATWDEIKVDLPWCSEVAYLAIAGELDQRVKEVTRNKLLTDPQYIAVLHRMIMMTETRLQEHKFSELAHEVSQRLMSIAANDTATRLLIQNVEQTLNCEIEDKQKRDETAKREREEALVREKEERVFMLGKRSTQVLESPIAKKRPRIVGYPSTPQSIPSTMSSSSPQVAQYIAPSPQSSRKHVVRFSWLSDEKPRKPSYFTLMGDSLNPEVFLACLFSRAKVDPSHARLYVGRKDADEADLMEFEPSELMGTLDSDLVFLFKRI